MSDCSQEGVAGGVGENEALLHIQLQLAKTDESNNKCK